MMMYCLPPIPSITFLKVNAVDLIENERFFMGRTEVNSVTSSALFIGRRFVFVLSTGADTVLDSFIFDAQAGWFFS